MKQLLFTLFIALGYFNLNAQIIKPTPYTMDTNCCARVRTITLNKAQIEALNTTPITVIIPETGKAVKFVKPPIMDNNMGSNQTQMITLEYIKCYNHALTYNVLSTFEDQCATKNGRYSGSYWHTYELIRRGQTIIPGFVSDGRIFLKATAPIYDVATDATMTFTFYYVTE